MKIKYFYYISKTKVDMLLDQVHRRHIKLPSISPKIEFAGLSFGVEVESQVNGSLIQDTLSLVKSLEKERLIKELRDCSTLDTTAFYHDDGLWLSGLFSFGAIFHVLVTTYLMWTQHKDSMIILVGSPLHILGEKVVREGVFTPSTGRAQLELMKFVENHFKTDAECLVRRSTHMDYEIEAERKRAYEQGLFANSLRDFYVITSEETDPVSLGLFCLRHVQRLPQSRVDTVFKVFRRYDLSPIQETDSIGESLNRQAEQVNLWNYTTIYLGSPIYTALA
jgi:hypothetical protein